MDPSKCFSSKKKNGAMNQKIIGPKAYIHIDRLKKNLSVIKNEIGNELMLVKANGYGHGALNITNALKENKKIIFVCLQLKKH